MRGVGSKISLFLLVSVGRLPWWIVTIKSSVSAWIMTHLCGYRKAVVKKNLKLVFGDDKFIGVFYKNFCDIVFESLKLFTLHENDAKERVELVNLELLNQLHNDGRNVILAGGHMANWEIYSLVLPSAIKHKAAAIYKKLSDRVINEGLKASREKAGMKIMEMSESREWMDAQAKELTGPALVAYIFDQSPSSPKAAWWTTFLGVESAFFAGLDNYAKRYDAAVVYGDVSRVGRGRYKLEFKLVMDDIKGAERGEVLDRCLGYLEEGIVKNPGNWLWSHNRWKHTRPENSVLHKRKFSKFEG